MSQPELTTNELLTKKKSSVSDKSVSKNSNCYDFKIKQRKSYFRYENLATKAKTVLLKSAVSRLLRAFLRRRCFFDQYGATKKNFCTVLDTKHLYFHILPTEVETARLPLPRWKQCNVRDRKRRLCTFTDQGRDGANFQAKSEKAQFCILRRKRRD